jgi:hypothetical protein
VTDTDDDLFEPASGAPPIKYGEPGPAFSAEHRSDCSEGDEIQPGDIIRADGHGGWAHASCLRMAARPVIWE